MGDSLSIQEHAADHFAPELLAGIVNSWRTDERHVRAPRDRKMNDAGDAIDMIMCKSGSLRAEVYLTLIAASNARNPVHRQKDSHRSCLFGTTLIRLGPIEAVPDIKANAVHIRIGKPALPLSRHLVAREMRQMLWKYRQVITFEFLLMA